MDDLQKYIEEKNKTHLIFDFDETIAMLILPWSEWFKDVAQPITKKEPELKDKAYAQIHNQYVQKQGKTALLHIRELNEKFETEKLKGLEVNLEAVSFIMNNPQYKYYIWSSNSKKTVERALKKLEIFKRFKKIITRGDSTFIKPNPDGFGLIKDKNIPKNKYLLVGNSFADENAAKAIGIDFYKISYFDKK